MARPATPVQLQVLEGNPNRRTKKQLADRQAGEIVLGSVDLKESARLRANKTALAEWRRIVKLYRDSSATFLTNADVKLLERRCLTHADYEQVRNMRDKLMRKRSNFEEKIRATNRVDTMLNRLNESLQRMDRELLLTPLSRISGLTRSSNKDKEDPAMQSMFGDG